MIIVGDDQPTEILRAEASLLLKGSCKGFRNFSRGLFDLEPTRSSYTGYRGTTIKAQ